MTQINYTPQSGHLSDISVKITLISKYKICIRWSQVLVDRTLYDAYDWSSPPFFVFWTSIFFSCTQHFATFYVLLEWHIYDKYNQTVVSIHTRFLTYVCLAEISIIGDWQNMTYFRRGGDHMVVGLTTTCAISAYLH